MFFALTLTERDRVSHDGCVWAALLFCWMCAGVGQHVSPVICTSSSLWASQPQIHSAHMKACPDGQSCPSECHFWYVSSQLCFNGLYNVWDKSCTPDSIHTVQLKGTHLAVMHSVSEVYLHATCRPCRKLRGSPVRVHPVKFEFRRAKLWPRFKQAINQSFIIRFVPEYSRTAFNIQLFQKLQRPKFIIFSISNEKVWKHFETRQRIRHQTHEEPNVSRS